MTTDTRPYPLAPLLALAGTKARLSDACGVSGRTLLQLETRGLSEEMADRLAVRLGYHPGVIWRTWFDDGLTVTDFDFVNRGGWRHAWLFEHGYVATNARTKLVVCGETKSEPGDAQTPPALANPHLERISANA